MSTSSPGRRRARTAGAKRSRVVPWGQLRCSTRECFAPAHSSPGLSTAFSQTRHYKGTRADSREYPPSHPGRDAPLPQLLPERPRHGLRVLRHQVRHQAVPDVQLPAVAARLREADVVHPRAGGGVAPLSAQAPQRARPPTRGGRRPRSGARGDGGPRIAPARRRRPCASPFPSAPAASPDCGVSRARAARKSGASRRRPW